MEKTDPYQIVVMAMRILEGDFPEGSKVQVDARVSGEALEFRQAG